MVLESPIASWTGGALKTANWRLRAFAPWSTFVRFCLCEAPMLSAQVWRRYIEWK